MGIKTAAVRSAKAAVAANERFGNTAAAEQARLDLREAMAAQHIINLVDTHPPLSAERRARLAALLTGGGQ